MTRVVHVISDAGPHPYLETIAAHSRDELLIGCVGPAGALQQRLGATETFALNAVSRVQQARAIGTLARLLRRRRADVVQTHLLDGCLVGLLAARHARVDLAVHTAHHSHELPFHGARLRCAERLCTAVLADVVIAPSIDVAGTLQALAHTPAKKIEIVHHGFELDRFDPRRHDPPERRKQPLLLALGRDFPLKNHAALLRAFARIGTDARLMIAGPGAKLELASLARELGVADRVSLRGPTEDVPGLLASVDAFVHPALAESFGMVVIEAMASAKPVLAAPVGIAPEVVRTGRNGVLASACDVDGLEAALRDLFALRARWAELGAAARRTALAFDAATMVGRYEQIYLSRTRESPRRRSRSARAAGPGTSAG